jgi:hypothetical protein
MFVLVPQYSNRCTSSSVQQCTVCTCFSVQQCLYLFLSTAMYSTYLFLSTAMYIMYLFHSKAMYSMYFFLSTAMYVLVPQYSNVQYVLAPQNSNVRHVLFPQQNNGCTCSLVQQCMYSFLSTVLYSMYFFLSTTMYVLVVPQYVCTRSSVQNELNEDKRLGKSGLLRTYDSGLKFTTLKIFLNTFAPFKKTLTHSRGFRQTLQNFSPCCVGALEPNLSKAREIRRRFSTTIRKTATPPTVRHRPPSRSLFQLFLKMFSHPLENFNAF